MWSSASWNLILEVNSGTTGASLFASGSSVMLIIASASLNWLVSLQTIYPYVTCLSVIWEPWMLYTI